MKVALAIIAALPFAAQAEKLYVQYEGVIVPTPNAPMKEGYHVGDRVSGSLLIDTLLAPRGNVQPRNGFANYGFPGPHGADFVSGWVKGDKEAWDYVVVEEGRGSNVGSHSYHVADANSHRILSLYAMSPLIKSLDLVQTFDIKNENENGKGALGIFEWGHGVVKQAVFRMTHFSVSLTPPGRCRA